MTDPIKWDIRHSTAVAGVMFGGLVLAIMMLRKHPPYDGWETDLFESISQHFDYTPTIPITGDGDRDALQDAASSEAMREAHRVLSAAFDTAERSARF